MAAVDDARVVLPLAVGAAGKSLAILANAIIPWILVTLMMMQDHCRLCLANWLKSDGRVTHRNLTIQKTSEQTNGVRNTKFVTD